MHPDSSCTSTVSGGKDTDPELRVRPSVSKEQRQETIHRPHQRENHCSQTRGAAVGVFAVVSLPIHPALGHPRLQPSTTTEAVSSAQGGRRCCWIAGGVDEAHGKGPIAWGGASGTRAIHNSRTASRAVAISVRWRRSCSVRVPVDPTNGVWHYGTEREDAE